MTIKPNLHLAILKCDTINQRIQNKYGDYNVMFPYIFEKAADKELKITWDSFNVVKMIYPDLEDLSRGKYDGIVISGSFASAYENQPWILKLVEFLSYMRTKPFGLNIRLLGVCFGHQILARVCGGVCEKNTNGWELGLYDVKLTPDGKRIFNTDKEFFAHS
ncbi:class I glutamine amidotransferase-like protein [Phycomyces nitens]|nr:class I glutamine amidotransferase-like protein [Phycomyces nitens]